MNMVICSLDSVTFTKVQEVCLTTKHYISYTLGVGSLALMYRVESL